MRLFFAFDLPRDQRELLAAMLPVPAPDVRLVPPDRLHVTLRWIGDVPTGTRDALVEGLSRIPVGAGTARIRGVGTFPDRGRPRVLWAGVEAEPSIVQRQADVERLCRDLGLEADPKPWVPHVTLGRVKDRRPAWLAEFVSNHHGFAMEPFTVREIVLYDSVPDRPGVRYEAIAVRRTG